MLVLSRKPYEKIIINDDIVITVVAVGSNQVRLGIEAPDSVSIFRAELLERGDSGAEQQGRGPHRIGNRLDAH